MPKTKLKETTKTHNMIKDNNFDKFSYISHGVVFKESDI